MIQTINIWFIGFGTKDKIELEYPSVKDASSFDKFRYSSYFRPKQEDVDGLNLNHVSFVNGNTKYIIYNNHFEYSKRKNESTCGIGIIDLSTGEKFEIKGKVKSKKGSLGLFSYNDLLEKGEEIFDSPFIGYP